MSIKTLPLLTALLFCCSCSIPSRAKSLLDSEADLSKYDTAVIYDSDTASFLELELMQAFRESGFKIVGEKDAPSDGVLGVRYSAFQDVQFNIVCTLEDIKTDKSLATIEGTGSYYDAFWGINKPDRKKATKVFKKELQRLLAEKSSSVEKPPEEAKKSRSWK